MDENMKYRIKNQKLAELVYSVFDKEDVQRQIEYQINGPYDEFIFTSDKEANIVIKLRTEYDDLENAKVNVQINIDKDEIEKIREYDPKGWNPFPQVEPPKNGEYLVQRTNKKRGLADSKYNERRSQCETALAQLQTVVDIKTLGDLTEEKFEEVKDAITDPINRKRAKHAVYENQRTIQAVDALCNNNIQLFGQLMNASHVSLRDDYEVTGIELDTLVEAAWQQEGVIGSRMTGAGFGGCTVSIVENDKIDAFIENTGKIYKEKIGYAADFYVVEIGDGAHKVTE